MAKLSEMSIAIQLEVALVSIVRANLITCTDLPCGRNDHDCELLKLLWRENIRSHFKLPVHRSCFVSPGQPHLMVNSKVPWTLNVPLWA